MFVYYCTIDGKMLITPNMADVYEAAFNHSTDITGTVWKDGKNVGEFKVKMYK